MESVSDGRSGRREGVRRGKGGCSQGAYMWFIMHPVYFVELFAPIVLCFSLWFEYRSQALKDFLFRAIYLIPMAWIAEDSCIRIFGFYQYSPEWYTLIDKMPFMVALIWPFVIISDNRLVNEVLRNHRLRKARPYVSLLTGFLIVWDACMMESLSVHAGLWSWNEPGFFGVPFIGVMGWGIFGAIALEGFRRVPPRWWFILLLVVPVLTHVALVVSWWGGFRWVLRSEVSPGILVGAAWIVSLLLTFVVVRFRIRLSPTLLLSRVPGALLFAVLAGLWCRDFPALLAFGASFVPPYFCATVLSFRDKAAEVVGGVA